MVEKDTKTRFGFLELLSVIIKVHHTMEHSLKSIRNGIGQLNGNAMQCLQMKQMEHDTW